MKKLALELDELAVETFDATPGTRPRQKGTVRAHDDADPTANPCNPETQYWCNVTEATCVEQTWESCYGNTCYGVSCGPEGSCSAGCPTGFGCGY